MAAVAAADPSMPFGKNLAIMAGDVHIEKQHIGPSPVPFDESSFLLWPVSQLIAHANEIPASVKNWLVPDAK